MTVKKIVVDDSIPHAKDLFSRTGNVIALPGYHISQKVLKNANGLIVRSITNVDYKLLLGTSIQFVGTTTSGTDHIDLNAIAKLKISFSSASGCNSIAVVEYVFAALLWLAERDNFLLTDRIIGIVGAGNIGIRLQLKLKKLGVHTLICDPFKKNLNNNLLLTDIDNLIAKADIITLHIPLNITGVNDNTHFINKKRLRALRRNSILINTCRGPVVDNLALLEILSYRDDLSIVLDVWEFEPNILLPLIKKVDIATPHIAGYSLESRIRSIIKVYNDWTNFIGVKDTISLNSLLPATKFAFIKINGEINQSTLMRCINLLYDIRLDDAQLRKIIFLPNEFNNLRKNYFIRREWSSLSVLCDNSNIALKFKELGFNASIH